MKNFSAIKRVVKHEKMAIYVRYPLYSWKYNFEELYAPYPIYSGNTLLCARYPFFSFFSSSRFMKKWHFMPVTLSIVGSIILRNFMPLALS